MKNGFANVISRKLVTTFITVTISSFVWASFSLMEPSLRYNLGNQLMGLALVYGMYIGAIVLVYGNTVSVALEYVQHKWFKYPDWIYVLSHGLFGLANGLLFRSVEFAILGMVVATFYAIIDRWLFARILRHKSLKAFLIAPVLLYGFSWGLLQATSPSLPYFTKEEAVEFATSGQGTNIDHFPKNIGEETQSIHGYSVTRETKVEEAEQEVYIVTFIERWSNGEGSGKWYISYKVKRGEVSAYDQGGTDPPYR